MKALKIALKVIIILALLILALIGIRYLVQNAGWEVFKEEMKNRGFGDFIVWFFKGIIGKA